MATKPRSAVMEAPVRVSRPLAGADLSRAVQGVLFPEKNATNVIPIESYVAPVRGMHSPASQRTASRSKTAAGNTMKPPVRKQPKTVEGQGQLEFLAPLPPKPRTLSTTVEAVIYCEAPVASPMHRAVAAAIDWSLVLIAYGLFLLTFHYCGGEFAFNRASLLTYGAAFLGVAFAYGSFWTAMETETPGMRWTHLRLITFDGFPPERRQRYMRFASACLSRCTIIGLAWAMADEETLGWQDHISRTFPTPYDKDSQVLVRAR